MRFVLFVCSVSALFSLPQGIEPQHGAVEVSTVDQTMSIALAQSKTIVNWDSFSIGAAEKVHIQMPGPDSSMLNRVVGGNLSEIYGTLSSNGQVWLINPAGILIGRTAVIETGAFLASTFDVMNRDFLDGLVKFSGESGKIQHLGTIRAPYGKVHLLAKEIEIEGRIEGESIETAYFFAKGESLIAFDPDVKADHPYAHAINVTGSLEAKEIHLFADEIDIQGKITAPGGEILIGGDYQGKSFPNAKKTIVREGSHLDVSGDGDAGRVIIWSDEYTHFSGYINARGAESGGDGGFVEVSGPDLDFRGIADRRAPNGNVGTLLLDPTDITISSSANSNITFGSNTYTGTAATANIQASDLVANLSLGNVIVTTTSAFGGTGNIIVNADINWGGVTTLTLIATSTITFNSQILNFAASIVATASGVGSGTNSGITLNTGSLLRAQNVTVNGTASGSGAATVYGVYFNGGVIQTLDGTLSVTGAVTGGSGVGSHGIEFASIDPIQFNTSSGFGLSSISGSTASSGNNSCGVHFGASFSQPVGGISLQNCTGGSGLNCHGIWVDSPVSSPRGFFASSGITGGSGAGSVGCMIDDTITATLSAAGSIFITAASNGTGNGSHGIWLNSALTTAGGQIFLDGTGGASTDFSYGVLLNGSMTTNSGSISITGEARGTGGNVGVLIDENTITAPSAPLTISGSSSSSGANSHGVSIVSLIGADTTWSPNVSGITFTNCVGGSGSTSHGLAITKNLTITGPLTAINGIQSGTGSDSYGCLISTNVDFGLYDVVISCGGAISITALSQATAGDATGIGLTNGGGLSTTVTTDDSIRLIGTSGTSASTGNGVSISANTTVTSTGAGTMQVGGVARGATGSGVSILSTASGTEGNITISGTTSATGASSFGVSIPVAWAPGSLGTITFGAPITDGTVTVEGCIGGSGAQNHGLSITGAFTTPGNVTATNLIQGGTGSGSVGLFIAGAAGSIASTSGGTINITASSLATTGAANGIELNTSGAKITTTGAGSIRLIGTSGTSSDASNGVVFTSGSRATSGSGRIEVGGIASGTTAADVGVLLSSSTSIITTGEITVSGVSTGTFTGSHGVSITSNWAPTSTQTVTFGSPITDGTVTVTGCVGGSGAASHGLNVVGGFTTPGNILAINSIQGGTGDGSVGCLVSGATASIASSAAGNVTITASSQGTSGNAHGIQLSTSGAKISTTGTGSIQLIGTSGTSTGASNGVFLDTGTTVTTSGGSGLIQVGGIASGTTAADVGVLLNSSNSIITTGAIHVSGVSAGTFTGSHGVSITAGWAPTTTQTVMFGLPITDGTVSVEGCIGGSGAASHGLNVVAGFTTPGSISAINLIKGGTGSGSMGVLVSGGGSSIASSSAGAITLTAMSQATAGAANGISVEGGTIGTTGSGTIALYGTSGASSDSSNGINLSSGTIATGSGTISLTGIVGAGAGNNCSGVLLGAVNGVTTSGAITVLGINTNNSSSSANGVTIAQNWNTGSSSPLIIGGVSGIAPGSFPISLGAEITNGAQIDFNSNVGLTTNVTIGTTSSGNLNFYGSIDGSTVGTRSLTLSPSGALTIGGNVGQTGRLDAFSITSGTISALPQAIAANSVSITPAVSLTQALSISNGGGSGAITFNNILNGAYALSISGGTGTTTFTGIVGGVTPLSSLTVSAGTIAQPLAATTTGAVSYTGSSAITIGGNLTTAGGAISTSGPITVSNTPIFDTTNGGSAPAGADLSLFSTVDGAVNVTLRAGTGGTISLMEEVGGSTPLTSLSFTSALLIALGADITTVGSLSFPSPVSLVDASTVTSSSGNITFSSTINGYENLTLSPSGSTTLSGLIGGTTPLNTVFVSGGTGLNLNASITAASVEIIPAITLNGPSTITTTGNISLPAVNGTQNFTLSPSGVVTLNGSIGALTSLGAFAITSGAEAIFQAPIVASSVAITPPVTLSMDTVDITANGGNIVFESTIDGAENLTLSPTGTTTLSGLIGSVTPLVAFQITTGTSVTLENAITADSILIARAIDLTLDGTTRLTSLTGDITLSGSIDGTIPGEQHLTIAPAVAASFLGQIGAGTALGDVAIISGTSATLGASIEASSFSVSSPVTISDAVTIATTGNILFSSSINNFRNLTLSPTGSVTLLGGVGLMTPLNAFSITSGTEAILGASLEASSVNITPPVTLSSAVTITTTGNVVFSSTINGAKNLSLAPTGSVSFGGIIGGSTPLQAIAITSGSAAFLPSSISSSSFSATAPITLSSPTTIATTGNILTADTITGGQDLTLSPFGTTTITGAISGLSAVAVTSGTQLNLGASISAASLSVTPPVVLTAASTITTTGNANFSNTINGAFAFAVVPAGTATLSGIVGGTTPIASFTSSGGTLTINGNISSNGPFNRSSGSTNLAANITTTNDNITFGGPLALTGAAVINSAGGAITFSSTINGTQNLTVTGGAGQVNFQGVVGGGSSLSSLTVSGSSIHIANNITASGSTLHFMSPVVLEGASIITDTGSGITFDDTITGPYALTLSAPNGEILAQGAISTATLIATGEGDLFFDDLNTTGSIAITSASASVSVGEVTCGANLSLQPTNNTTTVFGSNISPDGKIFLNGDLTATGSITLGPATSRTFLTNAATISANQPLTITADTLTIKDYDTLTVFGNLTFSVTGTAHFGAIISTGTISISSGANEIFLQEAGLIGTVAVTPATNIISRTAIPTISPAPTFTGSGAAAIIDDTAFTDTEFKSLLEFSDELLLYGTDSEPIPPPPPPPPAPAPPASPTFVAEAIFDMQIAVSELNTYRVPTWSAFETWVYQTHFILFAPKQKRRQPL